jgi:hypothetical protein
VEENLRFFGGACRVPPARLDEQVARLLRLTDLKQKQNAAAGSLSGGMRQLLSLGCALVHDPPLLFLDEPTSGLDPVHRHHIWSLLYDLSHAGKTILVTTHYMDEAERCTDVGFLHEGRLLAQASPRALKASFRTRLLEVDVDPVMPALVRLRNAPEILGVSLRSGAVRIYAPEPEKLELTLARIAGIVGEQRVGALELLDTHHPEGFRMRRFVAEVARKVPRKKTPDAEEAQSPVTALRRFRPPMRATVSLEGGQPVRLTCVRKKEVHGEILWKAGPWRFSGDWWEHEAWSRDEWDLALQNGNTIALYRLVHDLLAGVWFVEGTYD